MNPEPRKVGLIKETAQAIDTYWFAYGSPTSIGLYRICVGGLALIQLLMWGVDWEAWFSERGFVPNWLGQMYLGTRIPIGFGTHWTVPRINMLSGVTDDRVALAFFVVIVISSVLTMLGLWTRVSSIILALGVVSLQHRDSAFLHGGDSMMRLGCLYIAIAPSGKACSLDRLIGLWRGKISTAPVWVSIWPQRLVAYNVALVYLTTSWMKWGGGMWQNGTSTFYTARLPEFYRFIVPDFMNDFPFVYITTYGALFSEFALGTLVFFRPLRKYVLLLGILMHGQIDYSMNIPLFSYFMISTYICFYDGAEVSAWAERFGGRRRRWHVNVMLPAGTRLKPSAVGFLDSVDPFKLIHYLPGTTDDWTASRHNETPLPVARAIGSRSVGAWIFAWWPGYWTKLLAHAIEPFEGDEPSPVTEPARPKRARASR